MSEPVFPLSNTPAGFTWGPAVVQRIMSHKKYGVIIRVLADHGEVVVRVTPKGRVRIDKQKIT